MMLHTNNDIYFIIYNEGFITMGWGPPYAGVRGIQTKIGQGEGKTQKIRYKSSDLQDSW